MQEESFKVWLRDKRKQKTTTVSSRIGNCKRVEKYEGDLDEHYDADRLTGLMGRLNSGMPGHKIPIKGDTYNGTSTLKSAVRLYDKRYAALRTD